MVLFARYKTIDGFLKSPKSIKSSVSVENTVDTYNVIRRYNLKVKNVTTRGMGNYLIRNPGKERGVKLFFSDFPWDDKPITLSPGHVDFGAFEFDLTDTLEVQNVRINRDKALNGGKFLSHAVKNLMELERYDMEQFLCELVSEGKNASIDKLLNWIVDRIEYLISNQDHEILFMPINVEFEPISSAQIVRNALNQYVNVRETIRKFVTLDEINDTYKALLDELTNKPYKGRGDVQLEIEPSYRVIDKYEKEYSYDQAKMKAVVTVYSNGQNQLNVLELVLNSHETAFTHACAVDVEGLTSISSFNMPKFKTKLAYEYVLQPLIFMDNVGEVSKANLDTIVLEAINNRLVSVGNNYAVGVTVLVGKNAFVALSDKDYTNVDSFMKHLNDVSDNLIEVVMKRIKED